MADDNKSKAKLQVSEVFELAGLVQYGEGAVVSRTLVKNDAGTVTLFAFDQDQELSEHTAPFDALVQVIDGQGLIVIDGQANQVTTGQVILMPANIPHAVRADSRFKMLLTMLRVKQG
jgi:quercetin dioxygenase-like cupin family protein